MNFPMKISKSLYSLCLIASLAFSSGVAQHAGAQEVEDPDTSIITCLNSGEGVPTQLHHDVCVRAANLAWSEAQKTDVHSEQQQQLYWLQAGTAANIAVLTQVKIDQAMSDRACQIAKFGLQCFNGVDPEGPMKAIYEKPDMMLNFYQDCEAQGYLENSQSNLPQ